MSYENEYVKIENDRYIELITNEEIYKKTFGLLRDLLPSKEEIKKISHWEIDDLEGLFEEMDFLMRCLEDEIFKR